MKEWRTLAGCGRLPDHPERLAADRPVRNARYTLDELIAAITQENQHPEIDSGCSLGGEAW